MVRIDCWAILLLTWKKKKTVWLLKMDNFSLSPQCALRYLAEPIITLKFKLHKHWFRWESFGNSRAPLLFSYYLKFPYTANIYSQTTASLQPNGCISDWITAFDSAQWLAVIQYSKFPVLILSLNGNYEFFYIHGKFSNFWLQFGCTKQELVHCGKNITCILLFWKEIPFYGTKIQLKAAYHTNSCFVQPNCSQKFENFPCMYKNS